MALEMERYDNDLLVRAAAQDAWRASQNDRQEAYLNALAEDTDGRLRSAAPDGRFGPWGLGDSHWPLAEGSLNTFLSQEAKQGGLRKIVESHRSFQADHSVISCEAGRSYVQEVVGDEILDFEQPCHKKTPGMCIGVLERQGTLQAAHLIVDGLHEVRSGGGG